KGAPRYKGASQLTGRAGCLDDNALVDATSDMPRVSRFRCLRWVVSKLIRANPSRRTSDVTDASSWARPMEACLGAVQRLGPNRVTGPPCSGKAGTSRPARPRLALSDKSRDRGPCPLKGTTRRAVAPRLRTPGGTTGSYQSEFQNPPWPRRRLTGEYRRRATPVSEKTVTVYSSPS